MFGAATNPSVISLLDLTIVSRIKINFIKNAFEIDKWKNENWKFTVVEEEEVVKVEKLSTLHRVD